MAHAEQVSRFFHNTRPYLQRSYNIRLRRETVLEMVGDKKGIGEILDIGCGDGSLSLQLLNKKNKILLIDLSQEMLTVARSQVPREYEQNVRTICGDLMTLDMSEGQYDLILCMGVLAHVDSPRDFILKVCSLLRPGGSIIVTVSCGHHLFGRLRRLYLWLRDMVRPPLYRLRWRSAKEVIGIFEGQSIKLCRSFRYNFPAPGMDRLFSNEFLYRAIRSCHGNVAGNKRAWLGSEHILWLRNDSPLPAGREIPVNGQMQARGK